MTMDPEAAAADAKNNRQIRYLWVQYCFFCRINANFHFLRAKLYRYTPKTRINYIIKYKSSSLHVATAAVASAQLAGTFATLLNFSILHLVV